MGYYTRFRLGVGKEGSGSLPEGFGDAFDTLTGYRLAAIDDGEGAKWYDWVGDMLELSLRWPEVLFRLEGKGEEAGDHWVAYFRNGRHQEVRAQIPVHEVIV